VLQCLADLAALSALAAPRFIALEMPSRQEDFSLGVTALLDELLAEASEDASPDRASDRAQDRAQDREDRDRRSTPRPSEPDRKGEVQEGHRREESREEPLSPVAALVTTGNLGLALDANRQQLDLLRAELEELQTEAPPRQGQLSQLPDGRKAEAPAKVETELVDLDALISVCDMAEVEQKRALLSTPPGWHHQGSSGP